MLGLPKGEVFIVPWTSNWNQEFSLEKERIKNKIGDYIVAIYHIGSTAVENLSAKPILDIAIEINEFHEGKSCISLLKEIGYSYKGTEILPDRHYFIKGEPRTHQIHMYQSGSKYLTQHLQFRDYLRNHNEARIEYEQIKRNLSKQNKNDKHKYTEAKTDFINSALEKL